MAVSVRVVDARHPLVFIRAIEQGHGFSDDPAGVGSHQLYGAGLDRFRTFGFLPQNQDRFPEALIFDARFVLSQDRQRGPQRTSTR